jgi:protein kinase A
LIQSTIKLEDLDKEKIIGEGQFGTVWLVRADPHKTKDKQKMLEFAMKVQYKEDPVRKDGAIEAIKREMTVIHQLNHPFIIDLVDKYETDDQLMMLTEAVKGGELWSRIHREDDDGNWESGMPEADAKFYALVIADTVAYMHRQKIIFRDLKPENVLIDAEGYPTLCDFGFAKYCPDKTYTFCGTPNYLAPEIVLNRGHGAAVDHWALGIVAYEMITGENPFYFEGQDQMSLLQAIVQEPFYPLPETVSEEVKSIMAGLLEKDPVERLGSLAGGEKGILKHEWFSELDINQVRNKKTKAPYVPKIAKK